MKSNRIHCDILYLYIYRFYTCMYYVCLPCLWCYVSCYFRLVSLVFLHIPIYSDIHIDRSLQIVGTRVVCVNILRCATELMLTTNNNNKCQLRNWKFYDGPSESIAVLSSYIQYYTYKHTTQELLYYYIQVRTILKLQESHTHTHTHTHSIRTNTPNNDPS